MLPLHALTENCSLISVSNAPATCINGIFFPYEFSYLHEINNNRAIKSKNALTLVKMLRHHPLSYYYTNPESTLYALHLSGHLMNQLLRSTLLNPINSSLQPSTFPLHFSLSFHFAYCLLHKKGI